MICAARQSLTPEQLNIGWRIAAGRSYTMVATELRMDRTAVIVAWYGVKHATGLQTDDARSLTLGMSPEEIEALLQNLAASKPLAVSDTRQALRRKIPPKVLEFACCIVAGMTRQEADEHLHLPRLDGILVGRAVSQLFRVSDNLMKRIGQSLTTKEEIEDWLLDVVLFDAPCRFPEGQPRLPW